MTVSFTGEHQGLGAWLVDLGWNEEIAAELFDENHRPRKVHVLLYDPESNHVYTGVCLEGSSSKTGITVKGRGMAWWLTGPMVEERDYLSGSNKLSDPNFDLDFPSETSSQYWTIPRDSKWVIQSLFAPFMQACTFGVSDSNTTTDDIMSSVESFPVKEGQTFTSSCLVGLFGQLGPGHFRLRTVYTGQFSTPNLGSHYSSWSAPFRSPPDIHFETDPSGVIAGPVLRCQTALPDILPNGSFEDPGGVGSLNGWISIAGNWFSASAGGGHNGPHYMMTDTSVASVLKEIASDATGATSGTPVPQGVGAGQEYEMWVVARTNSGFPATDGEVYMVAQLTGAGTTNTFIETPHVVGDAGSSNWRLLFTTITIPDGKTGLLPSIVVLNQTVGQWDFDDATLIRTVGNYDAVVGPVINGVPGRTYRWKLPYRVDPGVTDGLVQMRAVAQGTDRPDVTLNGPVLSMVVDDNGIQQASWDIQLPSGYDTFIPMIYMADLHGGAVFIGEGTIVDTDSTTVMYDLSIRPVDYAGYASLSGSTTAPFGAESVHVELVCEAQSGQWVVPHVSLVRTDLAPATGNAIVADLLTDPVTSAALSVTGGTVTCPEVIPYDWAIRNLDNLDALKYYCSVISDPPREFRVNADRSVDVAVASAIFKDHSTSSDSPIILLAGDLLDIDVESLPGSDTNVEDKYTEIKVIGAERRTVLPGPPLVFTATAQVPGSFEVDWLGNLVKRTKPVTDATVNHAAYAQALADDLAAKEAQPVYSITATMTGANTRPPFGSGDWLYVYDPTSGLIDPTNPIVIDGETVFPLRLRLASKTTECGSSWQVIIRRTDGSTFDASTFTRVMWSDADKTSLVLGERPPDWVNDPQGGAAAVRYIIDRKSRPL